VSTIRFYERRNVIPEPSRIGRDRVYLQKDVRAIQFARSAQAMGLSLNEISELLNGEWNQHDIRIRLKQHREKLRAQIDSLQRIEDRFSELDACNCAGPNDCEMILPAEHPLIQ